MAQKSISFYGDTHTIKLLDHIQDPFNKGFKRPKYKFSTLIEVPLVTLQLSFQVSLMQSITADILCKVILGAASQM